MTKKLPESIAGGFSAIPHVVLDSLAFTGATTSAKALVFALIRQLNGRNNGHIQLSSSWLKRQGFTSSTIYKARDELIERGLIIQTKWGGLGIGVNLYAVTWLTISNYVGLHIAEAGFRQGEWARCELEATPRRPKPKNKYQQDQYDNRERQVNNTVTERMELATAIVTKIPDMSKRPITDTVNNVVNTNTPYKSTKRTVGIKGRSGMRRTDNVH